MLKKNNNLHVWRDYFALYREKKSSLLLALFLAIVQSFILVPSTYFVQQIFDVGLINNDLNLIIGYALVTLVLILANQMLFLWVRKLILKVTKSIIYSMRTNLVSALLLSDYDSFQSHHKGELHNKIVNDTERIDKMSNAFVALFIPSAISILCLLAVLFYLNWMLSLILLVLGPTLGLLMKLLQKGISENTSKANKNFEIFSSQTRSIIGFFDLIKSYSKEQKELEEKSKTIQNLQLSSQSMAWQHAVFRSLQEIIVSCISLLILVVGCYLVIQGQLSLGTMMSYYFVLYLMRRFMFLLSQSIPEIISGKESLVPVMNLLKKFQKDEESSGNNPILFQRRLELENVDFHYSGQDRLLRNLNLTINKGRAYAIIGSNGIGKSTLVKLILGFYKPVRGQVLVDDKPLSTLSIKDWRKEVGIIFQDSFIMEKSVRENLVYGIDDEPEAEKLEQIINASTLNLVVNKLPQGLDTNLSQGVNLSGGEKQKIAIARSLLSEPKLLILDEPTNHLDFESLKLLYQNLKALWFHPAILIITHNKDFLELADEVMELKEGSLIKRSKNEAKV